MTALKIWSFILTWIFFPMTLLQVIIGALLYWIGRCCKSSPLKTHGLVLAIAADQNMNTVWLGHPDETISSRTGRAIRSGKPKWYIKYLLHPFVDRAAQVFGDQPNHCIRAIEEDRVSRDRYEVWSWQK